MDKKTILLWLVFTPIIVVSAIIYYRLLIIWLLFLLATGITLTLMGK